LQLLYFCSKLVTTLRNKILHIWTLPELRVQILAGKTVVLDEMDCRTETYGILTTSYCDYWWCLAPHLLRTALQALGLRLNLRHIPLSNPARRCIDPTPLKSARILLGVSVLRMLFTFVLHHISVFLSSKTFRIIKRCARKIIDSILFDINLLNIDFINVISISDLP